MKRNRIGSIGRCLIAGVAGILALANGASGAGNVVISQIYGGGGNAGASHRNDFVELYNRSNQAVALDGWSLQYASATGNAWGGGQFTALPNFTLQPGQFFLIRLGSGGANGAVLPTPDATGSTNMSSTAGKLALVRNTTAFTVTCPLPNANIEDFVGWGTTASCSETAPATGVSGNVSAIFRKNFTDGCIDTDDNSLDLAPQTSVVIPRNSSNFAFCNIACCQQDGTCVLVPSQTACNGNAFFNSTCQQITCIPAGFGACCLPSGGCVNTSEAECSLQEGSFIGAGELCTTFSCTGACCRDDGSCFVGPESQCPGVFRGHGTVCDFVVCGGACCKPDGSCSMVTTVEQCANGQYFDGSLCENVVCIDLPGACCVDGICLIRTPGQCQQIGGAFQGFGVPCSAVNCTLGGACCLPTGVCVEVITASDCDLSSGLFQGVGTLCTGVVCDRRGACCFNGQCLIGTQAQCLQNGGNYLGDGGTCVNVNCDVGACCRPDGSCAIVNVPGQCTQGGGVFQGFGTTCATVVCNPTGGACCLSDGSCVHVLTPSACNGIFQGFGAACSAVECKGACCVRDALGQPTGECLITGFGTCNGQFQGLGTLCSPVNPCPQPVTGACCLNDGSCVQVTTPSACNGFFRGFNVPCAPNTCTGACCTSFLGQPTGGCTIELFSACPGAFLGFDTSCVPNPCPQPVACCSTINPGDCVLRLDACHDGEIMVGTTCSPNPCVVPGACCRMDGSCAIVFEDVCVEAQGVFQGMGSTCFPNPCPGVCCIGSICRTDLGPAQCATLQYSVFVHTFDLCLPNLRRPCCKGDFNHNGVMSVQDIFDFLAQWFAGNPICDINGSGSVTVQDIFDFLAAWFAGGCP